MINKILSLDIKNQLWLLLSRKVSRIFKINFVPAKKKYLPNRNHPLQNLNFFFDNQYKNFKNNKFNFNKDLYRSLVNNLSKNVRKSQKVTKKSFFWGIVFSMIF